jgi:hypothetical protein
MIYNKIGHETGKVRCNALLNHKEIFPYWVVGANHYRPLSVKSERDTEDEVELFCPRCQSITLFHFQHCWECGWFIASAPVSKADDGIDPAERSRRLHELFINVGLSKLNLDPTEKPS